MAQATLTPELSDISKPSKAHQIPLDPIHNIPTIISGIPTVMAMAISYNRL